MRQPRILMCPPDYYGIEYEINPWMSRSRGSDAERAAAAVADAARHARRPRRAGRADDAAAGLARPGVHRQRRADLRQPLLQLALPPRGARPRDAALRRLVRGARLHGRALAARACTSRGPATPCSAARRCSPAIASAATCSGHQYLGQRARHGRCCRWNWSIRASTTSTPASARWRPARRSTIPDAFDAYGRKVLRDAHPAADRGRAKPRRSASAATPWSSARRWSSTPAATQLAADLRGVGLHADRGGAGRVHQGRRQRQVPDAAPRRRGGGGVGVEAQSNAEASLPGRRKVPNGHRSVVRAGEHHLGLPDGPVRPLA